MDLSAAISLLGRAANGALTWAYTAFTTQVPQPTMEETIARLERVRTHVNEREKALWQKMEFHRDQATAYATKKQVREARMHIRLRLLYDGQIRNTQKTSTAIESHLIAIQNAVMNREVFQALGEGSRALGIRGHDEDAVDEVIDRLDEQHDQTRAVMELLTENPPDAAALDESDIESELKRLMEGPGVVRAAAAVASSPPTPEPACQLVFPTVPDTVPSGGGEEAAAIQ